MLLQTEPKLFHGMLRLRIGLIIQVLYLGEIKLLALGDFCRTGNGTRSFERPEDCQGRRHKRINEVFTIGDEKSPASHHGRFRVPNYEEG